MSAAKDLIGPAITLIGGIAPAAMSLVSKGPKMPKLDTPTPKATPNMPVKDDATARAAALKEIAQRSKSGGRQSTNLYEKEALGA